MHSDETDPKKVKQLSAFFLDELSGKETYGVGRYLDIDVNGLPERLTIDFNRAYNPNCARSPHYNCPYAVEKIPLKLRAGEKIPPVTSLELNGRPAALAVGIQPDTQDQTFLLAVDLGGNNRALLSARLAAEELETWR